MRDCEFECRDSTAELLTRVCIDAALDFGGMKVGAPDETTTMPPGMFATRIAALSSYFCFAGVSFC